MKDIIENPARINLNKKHKHINSIYTDNYNANYPYLSF
ncbi:hypothetical protein HNQ02_002283 [Flavobacterium sp. 7E]|nr:hypothetical protein [Flavobacterium sp. 7E]